jgi:hypothetical protein
LVNYDLKFRRPGSDLDSVGRVIKFLLYKYNSPIAECNIATGFVEEQIIVFGIKQSVRAAGFILVTILSIWAVYLLVVGIPSVLVTEVPLGEAVPSEETIVYEPYFGAWYSLLALLFIAIGLLKEQWLPIAWVGILAHFIFGVILIWGMGLVYMAIAGGFAVLLGVLQQQISHQKKWLLPAWLGAGIVILAGIVLVGATTPLGQFILVIGILLGLMLTVLQLCIARQRT